MRLFEEVEILCRPVMPMAWLVIVLAGFTSHAAADWPTYRGDAARSGSSREQLMFPLHASWKYEAPQGPRPAWPLPARSSYWQQLDYIEPRIVDDHAFHPVAAMGKVLFASSADDQVYCLDAKTGELQWTFFTDGPVRFAPVIGKSRVIFGSDDGNVYCVAIEDGTSIWKQRIAPKDYRVPGNGRVISAWPVRSGLVLKGDTVYAAAGIFPSQGVWLAALDVMTGEVRWKEQKNYSPQGYLLASDDRLFVPTGRSTPMAVDRATGKGDVTFSGNNPGTFAMIADDTLISGRGNDGSLTAADAQSRSKIINFTGRHLTVSGGRSFILGNDKLTAIDRVKYIALSKRLNELGGRLDQLNKQQKRLPANSPQRGQVRSQITQVTSDIDKAGTQRAACLLWEVPARATHGMIVVGDAVITGGDDVVTAHRASDGKVIWNGKVDGKAFGFAADDGRLIVTTDKGAVHVFAGRGIDQPKPTNSSPTAIDNGHTSSIAIDGGTILAKIGATQGYALVLGAEVHDGSLARELVKLTDLTVVCIDRDEQRVIKARNELRQSGLYGSRLAVHHVDSDELPFTDYFANLVISASLGANEKESMWPRLQLERVLQPGGTMWLNVDVPTKKRPPLAGSGEWTHLYANPANTASTNDSHISANVALQWFGGPGPRRMIDRHLRGPAPLYADGRMFIIGENVIVGVDAYNGTELWECSLPESQRYSMPFDGGYIATNGKSVFAAVKNECWVVNASSGEIERKIPVVSAKGLNDPHWGYLAVDGNALFGSVQKSTASRMDPSRGLIDSDYRSTQPVVTSSELFRRPIGDSGPAEWQYANGAIINATITIANDRVYFIESRNEKSINHETGRIPLPDLTASDLYLVAIDAKTGIVAWQRDMDMQMCRNVLYLAAANNKLVVLGSQDTKNEDASYHLRVLNAQDGEEIWRAEHPNRKPGALFHGEQVHHPVVLGDVLVAEPTLYDLKTGKPFNPEGGEEPFYIVRPGHSCGTMSGAGDCLFFRANNPTVMNLGELGGSQRFETLAPTRAGCWINIIPAGGLVLIPEASASCVCHYSLQTSMAFRPIKK